MTDPADGSGPGNPLVERNVTADGTSTDLIIEIGPRGWGKTELMATVAPLMVGGNKDKLIAVSPRAVIGERLGVPVTILRGNDRAACQEFFGNVIKNRHRHVLAVDEFDEYVPGGNTGVSGGYCCPALYDLVNYSRNKPEEIGMIVSARGTADITTNIIRAANLVFFFQTTEPNAIDYVRRWMKQGDIDFETIIYNLPKYVALVWCPGARGSKFLGFVKVIGGQLQWVTPDDPEWDPDWKGTPTTTDATAPPSDESTGGPPTPTPDSEPSTPPSGGNTA